MSKKLDPRITLKNRTQAVILAIIMPGLGHFYQGRYFKGLIFSVCILGTFFFGVSMGEGRTVYLRYYQSSRDHEGFARKWNIGYVSQVLVGAVAWPAIIQDQRYTNLATNTLRTFPANYQEAVTGEMICRDAQNLPIKVPTKGMLKISHNSDLHGFEQLVFAFDGEALFPNESQPRHIEYPSLDYSRTENETIVYARPRYHYEFDISKPLDQNFNVKTIKLDGEKRAFLNWYQVPLSDSVLSEMNGRLGKFWELAMVFTWIAGLLNILAIWDAADGPAYGYGDEPEEDPNKSPPPPTSKDAPNPTPA
jgi:hypothetical protein